MAQLDILSYFTQLFWLIIILSIFYVILLKYVLPTIKRVMKVRELTLLLEKSTIKELIEKDKEGIKLITNTLETINKNLKEINTTNNKLLIENFKGKNIKDFTKSNKTYIENITKLLINNK